VQRQVGSFLTGAAELSITLGAASAPQLKVRPSPVCINKTHQRPVSNIARMKFDGPGNTLLRSVGKPPFVYGTAWKKDSTTTHVIDALKAGFTAVDTAAQPRHYREDLVGKALRFAYKSGICKREDVFVSASVASPSTDTTLADLFRGANKVYANPRSRPYQHALRPYTAAS
jgi:hypothetical protein